MSGANITYSGFEDQYQQIFWFDNISLTLTTLANSSQADINLKLNNNPLIEDSQWGTSYLNLTGNWLENPVILTVTTNSPSLKFELNTKIYGFHKTKSKLGQTTNEGVSYEILENGSIFWDFYHNFYMPPEYSEFEFIIDKPSNWEISSVLDPTFMPIPFEGGNIGDNYVKINKTNAKFPGWWKIKALSPNYIDIINTKVKADDQWNDSAIFSTEDTIQIKTQVNNSNKIPNNLGSTIANLTIYNPMGDIWYEETQTPLSNGSVFFSEFNLGAFNTTGGIYNYTIFWSNGTALGGVKSNFILKHNSKLTLLKPDDPSGFVGDIFPVRVLLEDSENNLSISNSLISYNWTDGTRYIEEAASGIYETTLDSADLASKGLYSIVINSSKIGFFNTNVTLELNLGEETRLQRLESEYDIELHANSSLKFKFTDFDGDGIDGATVSVGISNSSLYSINSTGDGIYYIEFSTLYINNIGIYELSINFSAFEYQTQYHRFQFEVTKQSVDLDVLINNIEIYENSLQTTLFYDDLNISASAASQIDQRLISGANFSWTVGTYEENLSETINNWYNGSISCSPDYFILGINYIYLKFEHDNYKDQTFGFQILVNQIELNVDPIGFEDTINIEVGANLKCQIRVLEPQTSILIENATVSFSWEYGAGFLEEISPGLYEIDLNMPQNLEGTFRFNLVVIKDIDTYKTTTFSFFLVIGEPSFPTFLTWIIIISLIIGIGVLGTLSLRSYVILPRRRKKQSELLSRTQNYKDMENIQAMVIIHKFSGIPLFSKTYSILEKQKKELFAGFIQAITTIGEEIVGEKEQQKQTLSSPETVERIIELDFKYFYCLICDCGALRTVLVLKNKASDRLKEQVANLSLGLMSQLSEPIENWDGSLDQFEEQVPPIVNNYLDLHYKETFMLNNVKYIANMRKEADLSKMEIRILNVIYSIAKSKQEFYLDQILEIVHEENKDKIIDGIESLLQKNILIKSKK
ncbi:MAG: hypothetical protein EU548_07935 [Promethearchaeota archaeon]|nr:MAG: hypothetical protein EU548_07935 [Candidatus Lokiarchaeota archaeon]